MTKEKNIPLRKSLNYLMLVTIVAASLFVIEIVLRLVNYPDFSLQDRVLFHTFPSLIVDDNGSVNYKKNQEHREVAVYGKKIEYDIVSHVNNLGFLDNKDYHPSKLIKSQIFVGDSFTSTSGGSEPWVTILRETQNNDDNYYNLGVAGTGVRHFEEVISNFSTISNVRAINLMVITSDLYRGFWKPVYSNDKLWFCYNYEDKDQCKRNPPLIHRISRNESKNNIIQKASQIYNENYKETHKLYKSKLVNLLCIAFYRMFKGWDIVKGCIGAHKYYYQNFIKNEIFYKSIQSLKSIQKANKNTIIRFFHIPEKGEVHRKNYYVNLENEITELGIKYLPLLYDCNWQIDMYHQYDSHPNDSGYSNLVNCVKPYIDASNKNY